MDIEIQRIYGKPDPKEGARILVDRLWPRGVSKEKANLDLWLKEIAPSTELRKWFDHDPKKWASFKEKYKKELKANPEACALLQDRLDKEKVVLLYGAKDEIHNEAIVIKEYFLK